MKTIPEDAVKCPKRGCRFSQEIYSANIQEDFKLKLGHRRLQDYQYLSGIRYSKDAGNFKINIAMQIAADR